MSDFFEENLSNLILNSQKNSNKKASFQNFKKPTRLKQLHLKLFSHKKVKNFLQDRSKTDLIVSPSNNNSLQPINPQFGSPLSNKQSFLPVFHQKQYNPLKIKQLYQHHQKQKRLQCINKSISLRQRNELSKDKQQQNRISEQKYIKNRYHNNQILHNISFLNLKQKIKNQNERFRQKSPEKEVKDKQIFISQQKNMKSIYFQTLEKIQVNLRNYNLPEDKSKKNLNSFLSQVLQQKSSSKSFQVIDLNSSKSSTLDENAYFLKSQIQNFKFSPSKFQDLLFQNIQKNQLTISPLKQKQKQKQKQKINNLLKKYLDYDKKELNLIRGKDKL